jgi:hypothetical protein
MTLSYGISGFAPEAAEGRITLQGATSFAIISRFLADGCFSARKNRA